MDYTPFQVTAHPHPSPVRDACAYELGNSSSRNALIFIGGLGDGPHTVGAIRTVARHLEETGDSLSYSVFEIRLRSAFTGFGTSSLSNDVEDISALVRYLRGLGKEKIILMGNSTGCQDCMEYAGYAKYGNEPVDGFILQAPVSDRECMDVFFPNAEPSVAMAAKWIAEGKGGDCLPRSMVPAVLAAPISAYRLHSLIAKGGDDDYFSSDLGDEGIDRIWSRFDKPVLVLHSQHDEFCADHVDQAASNARYRKANPMVSPLSGIIPDASHTVVEEGAREWLGAKVVEFLRTLEA